VDTRRLRAFVTVVELGGISVAAEQLGYAQSTLSAQLRGLEDDLGVTVLNRTRVGTALTEAGRRILPYAREALDLEDRMRRAVNGERPNLRIGALETLADQWLPDILAALDHGAGGPGTAADVTLAVGSRGQLCAELSAGRLDVVFVFDNGESTTGPHALVGQDQVILVAAPQHPLAKLPSVTPEVLMETSFLIAERGCTTHMLVDRFGQDLTHRAPISMVTGSLAALRRMAAHGRGVALLPYLAAVRDLESGELVWLRVPSGLSTVNIEARWRTGLGPADTTVQALVRLARRHPPPIPAWAAQTG
jgi:DNA-binding transcriptional LysR family regulator